MKKRLYSQLVKSKDQSFLTLLPLEIDSHIFSFLSISSHNAVKRVNKLSNAILKAVKVDSTAYQAETRAEILEYFQNSTSSERASELDKALKSFGASPRDDSTLCSSFISGQPSAAIPAMHVAAIMAGVGYLMSFSHTRVFTAARGPEGSADQRALWPDALRYAKANMKPEKYYRYDEDSSYGGDFW